MVSLDEGEEKFWNQNCIGKEGEVLAKTSKSIKWKERWLLHSTGSDQTPEQGCSTYLHCLSQFSCVEVQ